jgi:hypothetical protein
MSFVGSAPVYANICSMPEFRYARAEYDPHRPWLVVGEIRHLTVELEDDETFTAWAAREWPRPRFRVTLEPGALAPWQSPG